MDFITDLLKDPLFPFVMYLLYSYYTQGLGLLNMRSAPTAPVLLSYTIVCR